VDRIDAKDFAIGLEKVKNELSGHLALSARAHSFQPVFGVLKEVMDVPPARFGVGLQRGSLLVLAKHRVCFTLTCIADSLQFGQGMHFGRVIMFGLAESGALRRPAA
jgi:hypothetical protein